MGTGGPPYTNPLRPKITIKDVQGEDTLYTYNAFDSSHDISIAQVNMQNSIGENGTFNILINDHDNVIPKDNIHSVKVWLELGKVDAQFQTFMIGFGDIFSVDRPGTRAQYYSLDGFGTREWAYQLYINRRETYRKDESDAKIYNILDNGLTKRLWRPLKQQDRSIQDITGWSRDGISNKVNTVYTRVDETFTFFGDLCDKLCDIDGAVWFIDYSGGDEVFTLTRNADLVTPIIIKSGDLQDRVNDDPLTTSYIKETFRIVDDGTSQSSTANRLLTVTVQDDQQVFEIGPTVGSTSVNNRALCQQIIIDNDARRVVKAVLSLSKVGEPDSPNSRVNGDVVLDNGSNKPTGTVLDEFHISLSSLKSNPEKIEVPLDISANKLDVAQSKIWIRLFQRSGDGTVNSGEPQDDPNNTVLWHHNGIFNTTQPYYSGSASGGDSSNKSSLSWSTTNQGPMYRVILYSDIRRLFARTNAQSANTIRLREQFIPTDFLTNPNEVMRYLSLNLSRYSKMRRGVADVRLTVPDSFIYRPYQFVSFNDGLSNTSDYLQVQGVSYNCNSGGRDDVPLGTLHANVTLGGLYNTLVGACSCL